METVRTGSLECAVDDPAAGMAATIQNTLKVALRKRMKDALKGIDAEAIARQSQAVTAKVTLVWLGPKVIKLIPNPPNRLDRTGAAKRDLPAGAAGEHLPEHSLGAGHHGAAVGDVPPGEDGLCAHLRGQQDEDGAAARHGRVRQPASHQVEHQAAGLQGGTRGCHDQR